MSVKIYAPASIGNVGVGFDVLGAAITPLSGALLGDCVKIESIQGAGFEFECTGLYLDKLPPEKEKNIVYSCYLAFVREMDKRQILVKPLRMTLEKHMPIGSGLGSSACSIVAALDALNQFHQSPLDKDTLLTLMGEMEALISGSLHYDNVAPCYLGGLQLMLEQNGQISQSIPCFDDWYWVMAYPGIEVATADAREILPTMYKKQVLIEHGRFLAGFIHACYADKPALGAAMMQDLIAEPYRAALLPDFFKIKQETKKMGALVTGISGSGPTLFTVTDKLELAQKLASFLEDNYLQNDQGFVHICQLDKKGSRQVNQDWQGGEGK